MTDYPSPPITVWENGDLEVYPDVPSACADLEVYDVSTERIKVFDRLGHVLRIEVHGYEVTDMLIDPRILPQPDTLERELKAFVGRVGPDRIGLDKYEAASLEVLLESLLSFFQSGPTLSSSRASQFLQRWRLRRR